MVGIDEKDAVLRLSQYFGEKPVVFDVGSNKGHWADIIIEKFKDYELHLFEPNKMLLDFTRIKYEYNDKIRYCGMAAFSSDDEDKDFFYWTNYHNELSSLFESKETNSFSMCKTVVKTTTIDAYCESYNIDKIDCLKIDTEGAEYDVLVGCNSMLSKKAIKTIQFEYSKHYSVSGKTIEDVISLLSSYGYGVYKNEFGEFVRIDITINLEGNDYTNLFSSTENLYSSCELVENYTQDWNDWVKKNTAFLPKMNFFLEIGCFEGLTTNYICDNLMNEGGRIICVDPLQDKYLTENLSEDDIKMNDEYTFFKKQYSRFLRNTNGKPVELIRETSVMAWPKLRDYRFDFIYIDGDHRKISVYNDGVEAFKVCKIGGYILFDDYGWREETKEGIDMAVKEIEDKVEIILCNYQLLVKKISD